MSLELGPFLRSFTTGSWVRLLLTIVLTTASVMTAYGEAATPKLIVGSNILTVCGAFYMEYRNFKSRSQTPPPSPGKPRRKKK